MRARLLATRLALVLVLTALATPAFADDGFEWSAPSTCPDAAEMRARVERRLGTPVDATVHGIAIAIHREGNLLVARIDMRGVTVANEMRTLTSSRCDDLADAVAVVVARLATEARVADERRAAAARAASPTGPATAASHVGVLTDRASASPAPGPWGGGVRALMLSGIGSVPRVGVGGELAGFARYHRWFGEVGAARWAQSPRRLITGAQTLVDIQLTTMLVRAGWLPTHIPLRAWVGGEMGPMTADGVDLVGVHMTSNRWVALQAGFGVAWQMSTHARLVGAFEVGAPIVRPTFVLSEGGEIFKPYATTARYSFGLEMGWR